MKIFSSLAIAIVLPFLALTAARASDHAPASAPEKSCHTAPAADLSCHDAHPAATPAQNSSDDYPLTTCVISGKPLGSMGKPFVYTYKQEGQPNQTVKFCCKGCLGNFEKNPAASLAKITAAREAHAKAKAAL